MMSDRKELVGFLLIFIFGIVAPIIAPSHRIQFSELFIFMVFAMTWNVQGGKMGYNTFGNIIFFGLGMYLCASTQISYAFNLSDWTAAGGVNTFVHTIPQYFISLPLGLLVAAIIPTLVALVLGSFMLVLRGHYFAIGTLGLGIAAGEFATTMDIWGGGMGMTVPIWPKVDGQDLELFLGVGVDFFFYLTFVLFLITFFTLRWLYSTRF
jgi:branched-chain amino acid transport system permease protein